MSPSAEADVDTDAITGTFEIHVFVEPLDPDPETAARFAGACRDESTADRRLKGLLLRLDYQDRGFVGVLQTSRYCAGTLADARRACAEDAAALRAHGFCVAREKIEAVATNVGVPETAEEAARARDTGDFYFEYHLLVGPAGEGTLTEDDHQMLRVIAAGLSARLRTPVPLSYNAFKPGQRFLNARTYALGRRESFARVAEIEQAVNDTGTLRVVKIIREYICSDSNKQIDAGWLEPLPAAGR